MCGRYSNAKELKRLTKKARVVPPIGLFGPRFNIAPTQLAPVIFTDSTGPAMKMMRWGLIPRWSREASGGPALINARSETIETKPAFKTAFQTRRCLVPADSFFEWQARAGKRQPFRILLQSGEPFCFAGVWEKWSGPPAVPAGSAPEIMESFAILTMPANDTMKPLHQRMPVMVGEEHYYSWLENNAHGDFKVVLNQQFKEPMKIYPVGDLVNSPANDDPRCFDSVPVDRDFFETQWWSDR
jgi:putative SOS response-associated peptidase YedK